MERQNGHAEKARTVPQHGRGGRSTYANRCPIIQILPRRIGTAAQNHPALPSNLYSCPLYTHIRHRCADIRPPLLCRLYSLRKII